MRVLARVMGLSIMFILTSIIFLQLSSFNIHEMELSDATTTAMTSTQIVEQENIEDDIYDTTNARKVIDSNTKYQQQYVDDFAMLVGAKSTSVTTRDGETSATLYAGLRNKHALNTLPNAMSYTNQATKLTENVAKNTVGGTRSTYKITFMETDWETGILSVKVQSTYAMLNGEYKTIETYKTNIIENNGVDTIKRFNIFFNANGGVCNESVRNVQKWKKYGELPIPQRKHYTFLGWYTELNGGTKVSANTIMGNGDVTLYAHWEANPFKNTIKHYAMDGDKKFYLFDTTNYTRRYEEKYQLSASEQGLTVPKGLALNTYGTTHVTGSAKEYPFGTQVTQKAEDMEYEFYYKTIDYKVTYNLNGGTNANGNKSSYNVLHGFNLGTPTKRGYTFLGWYDENGQRVTTLNGNIDNDFKNKDDMYNKLNTRTVGNKALTAKWKANEYTISYDGNGATSGSMSGNVATYDSAYAIQKNQYVRKGYTFIGWTTKADGTSDGYNWTSYTKDDQWTGGGFSDKLTNYNVNYWSGTWKYIDGQYGIQNGKMKLYAMWQINQYKIDLNSVLDGKESYWSHSYGTVDIYVNGKQVCNDVSDANVTLNYGDKWELKDIKSTKGHYYVKTTYSEYGVNGKKVGTSGTIGEHGVGLYPEWNTKVLGIHYHRNYSAGDSTTANQSAKYGVDGQKLDANPWNRAGYAFLGWSTDKNATKAEYSNQQSISNDWIDTKYPNIHLYAVWKPYTLTVRYHNDGAQKWLSYANGDSEMNVEGKDVVKTETVKYDAAYAHSEAGLLDVNRFTRKGYHDNGNWKIGSKTSTNKVKDAGGTLPNSKGQGLATYLGVINAFEKGDVTVDLYPEWIANTYTVKYNGNGENSGTTPSSSHTYDTAKNLTANGYVKNGYQFVGWNTQANGSGTSYSDKQSVKNLTATNGGTVTLYAQWKPYTLTIRYHGDGALKDGSTNVSGKDVLLEEKVAYNGSYSHLKDATKLSKDGYTPNNGNWIVGKNGTTVVSSSKSLANGETVGIYLGCISSLHKSNVTVDLYPEWIANTWTVKYDANGGNGDMENTTHVWNGGIKVRKNTFEKPLYTFRGWNLSRVNSGKTEWLYAKSDNSWAGAGSWYESGKQPSGYVKYKLADEQVLQACTLIKNDVITAHAQWTPNTYYVTYDANGGSGAPAQQAFVADSGTKLSTTKPTRTGYTFVNWDYMGNKFNPGDAIPTGWGSFTLKAQWKANTYTYNIKYVSSSGASLGTATVNGTYGSSKSVSAPAKTGYTTPTAQTVKFDSTSAKTITFTYNLVGYSIGYNVNGGNALSGQRTSYNVESSAYTLPTPSRTGYTFAGWTGSNGSTPQKSVTIAKGSTGNKSYTANWSINTYSIGYNLNGGSINGQKTSYNVTTESFTLPTPTRSGYTFTGWTGSNGNTPQKSVTIAKGSTGNKSYTANWEANAYTLTVNPNGGNINGTTSAKSLSPPLYYNGGNWWNLSGEKPSRTGYTFEGWYTSANGGTKIYNADGTCTNEGTYWKNSSYVHTGNLSVYAHWKANTYTITSKYFYYYQNNTWKQFDTKTEQRTYGSSFAPHNVNSPTGYHAGNNYGYYTEKSEYLGDGTVGTNNITVNQNIIVHVHYYPDTYAITYKPNGGSGSDQTQTVTYGISWTSKGAIYSKSGYTQTSWNTQANGSGTKYSLSTVQTDKQLSNVTLYAQWTPNTYAQTIQARYQNADGTWGSYSTVKSGNANYNATYSWSRAADSTYKAASISYTVTQANTKYVDVYRQMYNLKVTGDSGVESISGNGDYYAGSTASSTYKIKAGYHMTTLVGQGPDAGQTWTGYNNKTGTLGDTWGMSRNRQAYINTAKNTVSIAYGVNGGTINSSDYSINQWGYVQNKSNNPWFHVVTYGSKDDPYNASTFGLTRTGYTFVRWQNEKTGTNYDQDTQYDSTVYQGSSSSETTANTSSVNCYVKAIWSLDNYSIGYNLNGGSISGQKTSYNVTTENFTLPTPTRTGYTFTGWTGSNGSTPQKSVTIAKGSTGNKSYTANWSVNMYYFDLNGYLDGASSGGISGYGTCDIYMNGTLVANDVADFWQQYAYGTKYEIKDIKAATGKQYLGVQSGSLSGTITGTTSTYLSFKTNSTTIQYDANGGSGAPGNQTKVAGQTLTLSSTKPSRSGYTFRGWKEITKTNKYYQPGSSYTNDYNGQTITMRAVWVKNSGDWGNATRRDYGWYQTMNNGKYAVSHWIYYYIDTNARQIRVVVDNQRLQSLTNRHAYYYGTNNGWQLNYDSGMNDIQYGRVYDAWDEFNAQYGGGSNAGVHPVAAIYKYNDDGSLPAINLYSQMIMNIPGYNASYYGFIQQDWKLCQIQGLFPKISPLYSDDVSNMPQLSSEGMDDETMFDGAKSKQKVEEIPEIIDGDINSGIIESTIKKSDIPNVDKQPEKAATLPFGSAACGDDKKGIRTEPTTGDGGLN